MNVTVTAIQEQAHGNMVPHMSVVLALRSKLKERA
jgi:hypothetical protein